MAPPDSHPATGRTCRRCGEDELEGIAYTETCLMARDGVSTHAWKGRRSRAAPEPAVRVVPSTEVSACPTHRLDAGHYIPRHRTQDDA